METLKEYAEKYKPKKTMNVTDLPCIVIHEPVEERSGTDATGKSFKYLVVVRDGEEYRMPFSVVDMIQNLIFEMPKLTEVKVTKKGEGMNTKYQVMPVVDIPEAAK